MTATTVTTTLWYDTGAEEAARFYCGLFPDAEVTGQERYPDGSDRAGEVLQVHFTIGGQRFAGLNGGPHYRLTEACSIAVTCHGQEELDRLWDALTADGGEESQCGWLKDRWGLSWQLVPDALPRLLGGPDPEAAGRVMGALMGMKRIDVAALERAAGAVPAG